MPSIPDDLARDARETLGLVRRLALSPAAWAAVARQLTDLERALAAGDPDRVDAALGELELFGENRVATRVSGPAPAPPPPETREFLNRLVHDLDGRLGTDDGR